ncbi:hypothetical protein PROFUN_14549 [Planoprotostelium fungivorum]|uniref:Uncharacterized protein n=1 Tax=Planoprotostelium fungivorum TaxID=1890364 RepID=A0A2P6MZL5_9EUKA|nr:hypothetical protein PROFUN_14549 [Planoprotostelium fungivorum]
MSIFVELEKTSNPSDWATETQIGKTHQLHHQQSVVCTTA